MRWTEGRRSDNVENRRGGPSVAVVGGVGVAGLLLAVVVALLGGDPTVVLQQIGGGVSAPSGTQATRQEDQLADFVSVVLADTEDTWSEQFQRIGAAYRPPKLVLFSGAVSSACGNAQAAMGPFYCPNEQGLAPAQSNQLSVRMELQADCLAGVWAHQTEQQRRTLEAGDLEEALNAASRIGDDTLQRESSGRVRPDSFTHGTAAQRQQWFATGFRSGNMNSCDTFSARQL